MQNAVRVDQIETVVGEVEILGVRRLKLSRKIEQLEPLARQFNRRFGKIDASVIRARFGKLAPSVPSPQPISSTFKPARAGEVGSGGNVPLLGVAMRFDEFVETTRARRRVGKLHPARIRLPESAYSFLKICHLGRPCGRLG